jgi:hypothetical protein
MTAAIFRAAGNPENGTWDVDNQDNKNENNGSSFIYGQNKNKGRVAQKGFGFFVIN